MSVLLSKANLADAWPIAADAIEPFTARALTAADASAFRAIRLKSLQTEPVYLAVPYEDEAKQTAQQWRDRCAETPRNCFFGLFHESNLSALSPLTSGMRTRAEGRRFGNQPILSRTIAGRKSPYPCISPARHGRAAILTAPCFASATATAVRPKFISRTARAICSLGKCLGAAIARPRRGTGTRSPWLFHDARAFGSVSNFEGLNYIIDAHNHCAGS